MVSAKSAALALRHAPACAMFLLAAIGMMVSGVCGVPAAHAATIQTLGVIAPTPPPSEEPSEQASIAAGTASDQRVSAAPLIEPNSVASVVSVAVPVQKSDATTLPAAKSNVPSGVDYEWGVPEIMLLTFIGSSMSLLGVLMVLQARRNGQYRTAGADPFTQLRGNGVQNRSH